MRPVVALALLVAVPAAVRAEVAAEPGGSAALILGGGVDGGEPLAIVDGRVDRTWVDSRGALAIGVGARLRWRDGAVVTSDWDDVGDAVAVLRYLEATRVVGGGHVALAGGPLADVTLGRLVRGYSAAIEADVVHTGAHVAATWSGGRLDAIVDDVVAPAVVGGAARVRVAPAWALDAAFAADLGDDAHMVPATGGVEAGARWLASSATNLGAAAIVTTTGGLALAVDATWQGGGDVVAGEAYLEARIGAGAGAHAPLGALTRVTRERAPRMVDDDDVAGVGAAVGGVVRVPAFGELGGELRHRVDLGWQGHARLLLAAREPVQLGAWAAVDARDLAVAAEARVRWSVHTVSRLEATRSYGRDELGTLTPRWQLVAWFGTTLGW